ncbi:MAG: hypothetical protein M3370_13085 [Actinomycetota bacterium]|nr:hypothetical protein [Actinomycetota bacterium]
MSLNTALKALSALLLLLLVLAFTPLAEGESGTWQDTVGDVVWSGIFLVAAALLITGVAALIRRRGGGRARADG